MAKQCNLCKKKIGAFDNQGSDEIPLCYDCAHMKSTCENCQKQVDLVELLGNPNSRICRQCREQLSEEERKRKIEEDEKKAAEAQKKLPKKANPLETFLKSKFLLVSSIVLASVSLIALIYISFPYFKECNKAIFGKEHLIGFMFGRTAMFALVAFFLSLLFKKPRGNIVLSLLCIGFIFQAGFKSYEMMQSVIHTRSMVKYIPSIINALLGDKPIESYDIPETAWKTVDPFAKWIREYTQEVQALKLGMQKDVASFGIDNVLSAESMKNRASLIDARQRLNAIDSVISLYEEKAFTLTTDAETDIKELNLPSSLKAAILQGFGETQQQTIHVLNEFYTVEHALINGMKELINFVHSREGKYGFLFGQIFFHETEDNERYTIIVDKLTKLAEKESQIQQQANTNIQRSYNNFKNQTE